MTSVNMNFIWKDAQVLLNSYQVLFRYFMLKYARNGSNLRSKFQNFPKAQGGISPLRHPPASTEPPQKLLTSRHWYFCRYFKLAMKCLALCYGFIEQSLTVYRDNCQLPQRASIKTPILVHL